MTQQRVDEIVKECLRQEENCQYTAAGMYMWQKRAQVWKNVFVVAPIILGGFASFQLLKDIPAHWATYTAASLALLAGFFPAIFEALGMDMRVREISTAAGEFTNLRDRFRVLGNIGRDMPFEEVYPAFEQLRDRMDAARKTSPALPEKYFAQAHAKIKKGHYDHAVDAKN